MQTIQPGDIPFTTSNGKLAYSLYLAGLPFTDPYQPCLNIYDREILNALGFSGTPLEDAVRAAVASGKKGHVRYALRKPNELQSLTAAFAAQEKQIKEGEGKAQDHARTILERYGVTEEDAVRLFCLVLQMRHDFMNSWKSCTPLIRIPGSGEPKTVETSRGKITKYPGGKLVALNASAAVKKHLKV